MRRSWPAGPDGRLALRIGVNTGEIVVGRPREGSSFVTGDAVNVCARLEQAAAPGEILVGERTVAAARGAFELWLSGQPRQPLLRSGRCLPYGHGITYWPLGEVLKEHLGILESDPPEVVAERVAGRDGLGFTLGPAPPRDMHPLTVRDDSGMEHTQPHRPVCRLHSEWARHRCGRSSIAVGVGPAGQFLNDVPEEARHSEPPARRPDGSAGSAR